MKVKLLGRADSKDVLRTIGGAQRRVERGPLGSRVIGTGNPLYRDASRLVVIGADTKPMMSDIPYVWVFRGWALRVEGVDVEGARLLVRGAVLKAEGKRAKHANLEQRVKLFGSLEQRLLAEEKEQQRQAKLVRQLKAELKQNETELEHLRGEQLELKEAKLAQLQAEAEERKQIELQREERRQKAEQRRQADPAKEQLRKQAAKQRRAEAKLAEQQRRRQADPAYRQEAERNDEEERERRRLRRSPLGF
jgi:hypothetical protein